MMTMPILTMPDFSLDFVIETEALGIRLEAILAQEGKPIAYMSKLFLASTWSKSMYEYELIEIVMTF